MSELSHLLCFYYTKYFVRICWESGDVGRNIWASGFVYKEGYCWSNVISTQYGYPRCMRVNFSYLPHLRQRCRTADISVPKILRFHYFCFWKTKRKHFYKYRLQATGMFIIIYKKFRKHWFTGPLTILSYWPLEIFAGRRPADHR